LSEIDRDADGVKDDRVVIMILQRSRQIQRSCVTSQWCTSNPRENSWTRQSSCKLS